MLSSSKLVKESRGNVVEALKLGEQVTQILGANDFVHTCLVTETGVLEITPSDKWFVSLVQNLSSMEEVANLLGELKEKDQTMSFFVSYARTRLSKVKISNTNLATNMVLANILFLVCPENKLMYRRRVFAEAIIRHVIDLYWRDETICQQQMVALDKVLEALEVLYV